MRKKKKVICIELINRIEAGSFSGRKIAEQDTDYSGKKCDDDNQPAECEDNTLKGIVR